MNNSFAEFEINPRPQSEWIRRFQLGASLRYITNQDDVLETREQELEFGVDFESGDALAFSYTKIFEFICDTPPPVTPQEPRPDEDCSFRVRGRIPVPPGSYDSHNFQLQFRPFRGRRVSGFFQFQRELDFWDGDRRTLTLNPSIKWSQNLSFDIEYRLDEVVLPGGEFTSSVSDIGINYNFTNNWLTSTTLQYDNLSDRFLVNFRLNYIYRPGDDLFVVYNETHNSDLTDRALIVKFTHSFDF
jgi:hypothetical protein